MKDWEKDNLDELSRVLRETRRYLPDRRLGERRVGERPFQVADAFDGAERRRRERRRSVSLVMTGRAHVVGRGTR
jgi:hypothetical protein